MERNAESDQNSQIGWLDVQIKIKPRRFAWDIVQFRGEYKTIKVHPRSSRKLSVQPCTNKQIVHDKPKPLKVVMKSELSLCYLSFKEWNFIVMFIYLS